MIRRGIAQGTKDFVYCQKICGPPNFLDGISEVSLVTLEKIGRRKNSFALEMRVWNGLRTANRALNNFFVAKARSVDY